MSNFAWSPYCKASSRFLTAMVVARLETGVSDPLSYKCTCPAQEHNDGVVLLFYRYFANSPVLPVEVEIDAQKTEDLAAWHREITARLQITGKIRVAIEGFNVTVGGTKEAIQTYIDVCVKHWSFSNLPLSSEAERKAFFKPSQGCACVFQPATETSVRVCAEITPLGITNYTPSSWNSVEELPPAEFHRRCHEDNVALMDLRNHYESRIGYFIDPQTGEAALRPQIRRFSQWPRYFKTYQDEEAAAAERQILTYCTGGIRCEKATRWMAERNYDGSAAVMPSICTLKGGIAAYLDWIDEEIAVGRMTTQDSLFKGKNYVFDARGAMGLVSSSTAEEPVSQCHVCGKQEDRLSKCRSPGCHLVLVVCEACEVEDPRCCQSCRKQSVAVAADDGVVRKTKEMCVCEQERELGLWGKLQQNQQQGRRKSKTKGLKPQIKVMMAK